METRLHLIFAARLRSWVMARPVRRKRVPIPTDNADDDERAPSEEQHHGADHDQHHDEVHGHGRRLWPVRQGNHHHGVGTNLM